MAAGVERLSAEHPERPGRRSLGARHQRVTISSDHLLVLAMPQHPSNRLRGRFVLAYPAGNPSFASVVASITAGFTDRSTFAAGTIEDSLLRPTPSTGERRIGVAGTISADCATKSGVLIELALLSHVDCQVRQETAAFVLLVRVSTHPCPGCLRERA